MATRVVLGFLFMAMLLIMSPSVHAKETADFLAFSVLWPGAYCVQTDGACCFPKYGKPALDFLITGLRTYRYSKDHVEEIANCKTNYTLNTDVISDIIPRLIASWTNIGCPTGDSFSLWLKSWRTHGACTGYTPREYLQLALYLYSKADFLKTLSQAGIKPDYTRYHAEQIQSAIAAKLKVTPAIECGKLGAFDQNQVYQIYLCADKKGNFMDCPPNLFSFTCFDPNTLSNEALFYGFDYWMLRDCSRFASLPSPASAGPKEDI